MARGATLILLGVGLYLAFFVAPPDYQQGETVRIMFVHVPAAWLAMFGYTLIAVAALGTLIWRHPLADVAAKAAAPIGATFTFVALVTGSLWGKPMWGTYWVWDARLTSVLVLFLLYLGLIALWQAIEEPGRAGRAAAILALVGAVNLPIIKFSVDWWNTLHQPASVIRTGGPDHRPVDADAAVRHGGGLRAALRAAASHRHARRDPAPPRARAAADASGARRPGRGLGVTHHARSRPARDLHLRRLWRGLRRRWRRSLSQSSRTTASSGARLPSSSAARQSKRRSAQKSKPRVAPLMTGT